MGSQLRSTLTNLSTGCARVLRIGRNKEEEEEEEEALVHDDLVKWE